MKGAVASDGYLLSKRHSYYVFILLFLLSLFDYMDRLVVVALFPFPQIGGSKRCSGTLRKKRRAKCSNFSWSAERTVVERPQHATGDIYFRSPSPDCSAVRRDVK